MLRTIVEKHSLNDVIINFPLRVKENFIKNLLLLGIFIQNRCNKATFPFSLEKHMFTMENGVPFYKLSQAL